MRIYALKLSSVYVPAFFMPVFHHLNIFNGFNKKNKHIVSKNHVLQIDTILNQGQKLL